MFKVTALALLATLISGGAPAHAAIAETAPYYMCFAYTQDGMLFAGGDFDFKRAKLMVGRNCNMPKTVTVVLLKTIMVRRSGKILTYAR